MSSVVGLHKIKVKVTAPHIYQVTKYSKGYWTGFKGNGGRKKDGQNKDKNRNDVCRRQRSMVIDLANCNFNVENAKFLTLTFGDNVTDVGQANKMLSKFFKAIKRKLGDFKYLWVVEFQERGAVHYHVLLDFPEYIPFKLIWQTWGQGFIWVNKIKHVDNLGAYISKYMTKNVEDERLRGNRSWGRSRGLSEPMIITGRAAVEIARAMENRVPVYSGKYTGEFVGDVEVSQYNLKRGSSKEVLA